MHAWLWLAIVSRMCYVLRVEGGVENLLRFVTWGWWGVNNSRKLRYVIFECTLYCQPQDKNQPKNCFSHHFPLILQFYSWSSEILWGLPKFGDVGHGIPPSKFDPESWSFVYRQQECIFSSVASLSSIHLLEDRCSLIHPNKAPPPPLIMDNATLDVAVPHKEINVRLKGSDFWCNNDIGSVMPLSIFEFYPNNQEDEVIQARLARS